MQSAFCRAPLAQVSESPLQRTGGSFPTTRESMTNPRIADRVILDTPMAVIDLETTGLVAGGDKVVEVAVARVEPGRAPTVVLDTLINPRRRMGATEIHGITDADVRDAPTFEEAAGNVAEALGGSMVGAYNVYFDTKFLASEFRQVGIEEVPPHLCLMYMRPLLGLGKKCSLAEACRLHGIAGTSNHQASADVLAEAQLWQLYATVLGERGIRTFEDLKSLGSYKFLSSFSLMPFDERIAARLNRSSRLKPRGATPARAALAPATNPLVEYWDALLSALADLELTEQETADLRQLRHRLDLSAEEVRWAHASVFSGLLTEAAHDRAVSINEARVLWKAAQALRVLGWAPGDPPPGTAPGTPSVTPGASGGFLRRLFGLGSSN